MSGRKPFDVGLPVPRIAEVSGGRCLPVFEVMAQNPAVQLPQRTGKPPLIAANRQVALEPGGGIIDFRCIHFQTFGSRDMRHDVRRI